MATTDHGYLFGAFDFWNKANRGRHQADHRRRGLRHPGTARHRQDPRALGRRPAQDDVSGGGAYTHMTLLSRNNRGHAQPLPASSLASLEGYFGKPRMDRDLLQTYARG